MSLERVSKGWWNQTTYEPQAEHAGTCIHGTRHHQTDRIDGNTSHPEYSRSPITSEREEGDGAN